jgi:ABC-type antimicrobial peptide transport system permease subunit
MIYGFGILGFILGFIFGQMLIFFLLRHRSREDLLTDKGLKWKYGLLNWGFAAAGAYLLVVMYNRYFLY